MSLQCPFCAAIGQILIDAEDISIIYCGHCESRFDTNELKTVELGEDWQRLIKALTIADDVLNDRFVGDVVEEIKLDIPNQFKEEIKQMLRDLIIATKIEVCTPLNMDCLDMDDWGPTTNR